jgi:hypothetical protein
LISELHCVSQAVGGGKIGIGRQFDGFWRAVLKFFVCMFGSRQDVQLAQ